MGSTCCRQLCTRADAHGRLRLLHARASLAEQRGRQRRRRAKRLPRLVSAQKRTAPQIPSRTKKMLVRPATLSASSRAPSASADWPLTTTEVSLVGRTNSPSRTLRGKPWAPRRSAVAANVPPPRKDDRSCGSVGPSGCWCQILRVTITEPPSTLSSSMAEGSHGGLMALQTAEGRREARLSKASRLMVSERPTTRRYRACTMPSRPAKGG